MSSITSLTRGVEDWDVGEASVRSGTVALPSRLTPVTRSNHMDRCFSDFVYLDTHTQVPKRIM